MKHKERHGVELSDGRRVKFTIAPRAGGRSYFVYFRGADRRRLERSTGEDSQKRALEAALQIIKEEHNPRPGPNPRPGGRPNKPWPGR